MEKFMFLFRGGDSHPHNATASKESMAKMGEWTSWMQELGQKGIMAGGEALQPKGKSVTGRNKVVTEGTFKMEASDTVGGFVIVNAKDINEAVEISKGCPIFSENGNLEIRQVAKVEM